MWNVISAVGPVAHANLKSIMEQIIKQTSYENICDGTIVSTYLVLLSLLCSELHFPITKCITKWNSDSATLRLQMAIMPFFKHMYEFNM